MVIFSDYNNQDLSAKYTIDVWNCHPCKVENHIPTADRVVWTI